MTARDLLGLLHEQWPPAPPIFAMSRDTFVLLQTQVAASNDRAVRWQEGLAALGAKIDFDDTVQYGHIVKRK